MQNSLPIGGVGGGPLQQDGPRLSYIYIIICMQFLVAQREHLLAALVFLFGRHLARDVESLRAGTLAVAEHVVLADRQRLHESKRLGKEFVCLAAHAHDDIHADEGVGDVCPDFLYLLPEEPRVVVSVHEAQHLVAAALERDVEVRHESPAIGAEADDFFRQEVRFDAADAVALDAFHLVEGTKQVDEPLARRLSEVADVDACQHDFLASLACSLLSLPYERFDAPVAASSSGKGNGAVGAEVVAAVLHFKEEPSALPASTSRREIIDH